MTGNPFSFRSYENERAPMWGSFFRPGIADRRAELPEEGEGYPSKPRHCTAWRLPSKTAPLLALWRTVLLFV